MTPLMEEMGITPLMAETAMIPSPQEVGTTISQVV